MVLVNQTGETNVHTFVKQLKGNVTRDPVTKVYNCNEAVSSQVTDIVTHGPSLYKFVDLSSVGSVFNMPAYLAALAAYNARKAEYVSYKIKRNLAYERWQKSKAVHYDHFKVARREYYRLKHWGFKRFSYPFVYTLSSRDLLVTRRSITTGIVENVMKIDRFPAFSFHKFLFPPFILGKKPRKRQFVTSPVVKPCTHDSLTITGQITIREGIKYGTSCSYYSTYAEKTESFIPPSVMVRANDGYNKVLLRKTPIKVYDPVSIKAAAASKVQWSMRHDIPEPLSLLQQVLEFLELLVLIKTVYRGKFVLGKTLLTKAASSLLLYSLVIAPTISALRQLFSLATEVQEWQNRWNLSTYWYDRVHYKEQDTTDFNYAPKTLDSYQYGTFTGTVESYEVCTILIRKNKFECPIDELLQQLLGLDFEGRDADSYLFEIWNALPLSFVVDFFFSIADDLNELKMRPFFSTPYACYGSRRKVSATYHYRNTNMRYSRYNEMGAYTGELQMSQTQYNRNVITVPTVVPTFEVNDLTPTKVAILSALAILSRA